MISLTEAHRCISMLESLQPVRIPLDKALGLVCAEDVYAVHNCPTVDSSLKDGFAVVSSDIAEASPSHPVTLAVTGSLTAGDEKAGVHVSSGTAVRIMTGAAVPQGATAVLASEFAEVSGAAVTITADSRIGLNILCKGSDIVQHQRVLAQGEMLGPAHLGLLAAAGVKEVICYPVPRVAIAATGSELVWPGDPLTEGKVAASNMVTAAAELQAMGITASTVLVRDNLYTLHEHFQDIVRQVDMLITCGGVLDGDKDLTLRAMEQIGMVKIFHRVRIGPGKGACMGMVGKTIVFNLPGGPPSNHVALLLLALSGVRRLMGFLDCLPRKKQVFVSEELVGQTDWTQLVYSRVHSAGGSLHAVPLSNLTRFAAMAKANALIELPEGCAVIKKGSLAGAWFYPGYF
ncbi:molybdopterin molybdotransferase MoeA [Desulfopila sp. IMCC35006]|uniref:molybdopterin molybdotransferase MoeA n=1 Tax=Desulfopila sp. IMCC35006 TaxID=2569542 RepID=UPI0010AC5C14|nr:gephyrin-like molybdotransferase Glp [Desulfopila sp. IMCC35006]TKB23911.1 molybdopterin molybdotransferase MoeA [Desulfopila sp. IMCC35006]